MLWQPCGSIYKVGLRYTCRLDESYGSNPVSVRLFSTAVTYYVQRCLVMVYISIIGSAN